LLAYDLTFATPADAVQRHDRPLIHPSCLPVQPSCINCALQTQSFDMIANSSVCLHIFISLRLQTQSFDQEFENMNKALKISCLRGLPVRVVRSFKEKRSSYAPPTETPVRYDGIYRILRCWRKKGAQGFLMCRWV
jgi:hypothetical protein